MTGGNTLEEPRVEKSRSIQNLNSEVPKVISLKFKVIKIEKTDKEVEIKVTE